MTKETVHFGEYVCNAAAVPRPLTDKEAASNLKGGKKERKPVLRIL